MIGSGGSKLRELESKHGVNIATPPRGSDSDRVELEGPACGLEPLRQEIEEIVGERVEVLEALLPGQSSGGTDGADHSLPVSKHAPINLDQADGEIAEAIFFSPGSDMLEFLRFLDYLTAATASLDIAVFTLTHDVIADAVLKVHRRGVTVRIITDDDKSVDEGSDIGRLREAGIAVRMDDSPAHMHHKFAVLDGKVLITGSFNWTVGAQKANDENVLITNQGKLVKQYADHFEVIWERYKR